MSLKRYDSYRDSEISWLESKIPSHWDVKRIKDLGDFQSGSFISTDDFEENGQYPVYGGNGVRGFANKFNHSGEYILIGRQGALCGNINYAYSKFWATEHAVVVYKRRNINTYWFGELLKVMNLNQYSLSAAQPGLSVEKIKRLELPFIPNPEEQTQIANYLDRKTTAIDKKISLLKKKIDTYKELRKSLINETVCRGLDKNVKLVYSGIDWIGEIPEHWTIGRLKELLRKNITDGPHETPEFTDTGYPFISVDGIVEGELSFDGCRYVSEADFLRFTQKVKIEKDDIFIGKAASTGKIARVKVDFPFTIWSPIAVVKLKKEMSPCFVEYYFKSEFTQYQIEIYCTHNTQKNIAMKDIPRILLLLPPLIEQKEIVQYLDQKIGKIDQIITNITAQIDTLKELRKTLINDVVTGKIKVSG